MPKTGDQSTNLLERARYLDRNALGEIHDRYYPVIYRYVRFRLADENACQQIVHQVFGRFLVSVRRKPGPRGELQAWLLAMAKQLVDSYLREHESSKVGQAGQGTLLKHLAQQEAPEITWAGRWPRERVQLALQELPHDQQHVLALRFTAERSLDESADLIGKRVRVVYKIQSRALSTLRKWLGEALR